jgi:hypothetical protein
MASQDNSENKICPVCKIHVTNARWKSHLRYCLRKSKLQAEHPVTTHTPDVDSGGKPKDYVFDEFGVVHTYREWFVNEMMGDHLDPEPVPDMANRQKQKSRAPKQDRKPNKPQTDDSFQQILIMAEHGRRQQPCLQRDLPQQSSTVPKHKRKHNKQQRKGSLKNKIKIDGGR